MFPDANSIFCLALSLVSVCACAIMLNRSRRAARDAWCAAHFSRMSRSEARDFANTAKEHAERLDLPRLLTFPADKVRGPGPTTPTTVRNPEPLDAPDWRDENPPNRGA